MNARPPLLCAAACVVSIAQAHVTLVPGGATAGSDYPAAFRVGHACKDAGATTAIRVRVPPGFTPVEAVPRPGWTVTLSATEVAWVAASTQAALPAAERANFVVRGRLTDQPGTLWFKVLQVCDQGSSDWAQLPARDGDKPEFPAARLDVLAPGVAPVEVRDAWARSTVEGQRSTGVFARLTAGAGSRLVGASSPWAQAVEIHEMTMDGEVMRMRPVEGGLELPVGEPVELRPGGYHLMLLGLKQALPGGASVPLTLRFVDREGRPSERVLGVPAKATAAGAEPEHRHGP